MRVGDLAAALGISQSTCSHHVRKLADVGLRQGRQGRHREHRVGQPRLLHRAAARGRRRDGHAGRAAVLPGGPPGRRHHPRHGRRRPRRRPRHLRRGHRHPQRHLRDRGADGRGARREVAARSPLGRRARRRGRRLDRRSARSPAATCYAGVGETSVYVAETARGRGVGKALLWRQVNEADAAGLWTLQTSVFPENRASHRPAPLGRLRTLAVRSRIAQLDGVWRDTVLLERRRPG